MIVGKLLESKNYNDGYNAQTGQYTDLVKAGIIDPAKVVRTAIQDAASVAGLLITTEAMIAEAPKKDAPMPMPGARRRHGRHGFLRKSIRPKGSSARTGQAQFVWWNGLLIHRIEATAKGGLRAALLLLCPGPLSLRP